MTVNASMSMFVAGLCLAGCQTQTPVQQAKPAPVALVGLAVPSEPSPQPRRRSPEQVQLLQDFAIKESPKIWQTIQAMRAEMTASGSRIRSLRDELQLFGRSPESDDDYRALVAGLKELRHAYDAIFDKLEDAYIAAKKYEASPSRKDYQSMMKQALEDGFQDATMATERYKAMTRMK